MTKKSIHCEAGMHSVWCIMAPIAVVASLLHGVTSAFQFEWIQTSSHSTCINRSTTIPTKRSNRFGNRLKALEVSSNEADKDISYSCRRSNINNSSNTRRSILSGTYGLLSSNLLFWTFAQQQDESSQICWAAPAIQDSLDVDNFLRTGVDGGGNMGVSSQAGKSRPETGVVLRDGSDVLQDRGSVLAELVLNDSNDNPLAVLSSFTCPWPLATGPVFDVECRDNKTGDSAFLAVTSKLGRSGSNINDVSTSFLFERLFDPTGRFSFYGPPTDIKVVKKGAASEISTKPGVRYIEVTFSNLSQSTGAEIPRHAIIAATIPPGAQNVVMLVASASATRWKQSSVRDTILKTVQSFQASPAPKTNLKIRAKPRGYSDAGLL